MFLEGCVQKLSINLKWNHFSKINYFHVHYCSRKDSNKKKILYSYVKHTFVFIFISTISRYKLYTIICIHTSHTTYNLKCISTGGNPACRPRGERPKRVPARSTALPPLSPALCPTYTMAAPPLGQSTRTYIQGVTLVWVSMWNSETIRDREIYSNDSCRRFCRCETLHS